MKISKELLELVKGGELTTFFGKFATGKTTFCLMLALHYASIKDGFVIFIDSEKSFSPERALQIKDDKALLNKILIFKAQSLDDLNNIVEKLEGMANNISLVIIDSLGPIYRTSLENEFFETVNDDLRRALASLKNLARQHKFPVVLTSQVYELPYQDENFVMFSTTERAVGGSILESWSNTLVWLRNYRSSHIKLAQVLKPKEKARELLYEIGEEGITFIKL